MNDGLKQRLIGALVLTGIAVIFLPDFFKQHQPHPVDTRTQIPPRPDSVQVVIDAPEPVLDEPLPDPDRLYLPRSGQKVVEDLAELEAQSATSASSRASSVSSRASSVSSRASSVSNRASSVSNRASSVSSSAGSVTAASASSPAAADEAGDKPGSSASSPVLDAWVVQVASLRSAESAQQLRKRLQARGYKAYVRQAQTGQGEVSRVFIGPKLDKALAEAVKQEIDPVFKVDSLVLRFKP